MLSNDPKNKGMSAKVEIRDYQFWKAVRCEFLGTLLYVLFGCGAIVEWNPEHAETIQEVLTHNRSIVNNGYSYFPPAKTLTVALTFGLSTATLVQCMGHISGAHLNPAVTMAMLVTRNISPLRALFYGLAQLLGGISGAGILYGISPVDTQCLGMISPHPHLTMGQAFAVEFLITFVVVLAIFANLEPKRADLGSRSLSIGLTVALVHLFALNYTGAGLNPARCLGPAIVTGRWEQHWVYWVGPMLGGIIGGFTHEYTQDSASNHFQVLRRSFRRRHGASSATSSRPPSATPSGLKHAHSTQSANSLATEMTFTAASLEDMRI